MTNSVPWKLTEVTITIIDPRGSQSVQVRNTWQGLSYLGTPDARPITSHEAALFRFPEDRLQGLRDLSSPGFAFHKPRCRCPQCRTW